MSHAESRSGGWFFLLAAWVSPGIAVAVVAAFFLVLLVIEQYKRKDSWILGCFTLACVFGVLPAVVSLFGIRRANPWLIVPGAILGLLLNVAVGFVVFMLYALSGLPGP